MYSNKFENLHKCKCNLLNVRCYLEFDFCKFLLLLLIFFNILRLVGVRVHPMYVDFFSLINEFRKHLVKFLQAVHFLFSVKIVHFW